MHATATPAAPGIDWSRFGVGRAMIPFRSDDDDEDHPPPPHDLVLGCSLVGPLLVLKRSWSIGKTVIVPDALKQQQAIISSTTITTNNIINN